MVCLDDLPEEQKKTLNEFIEQHFHYQSIQCHCKDQPKKKNGFIAFIEGVYYLTLAKWFNPLQYELAWMVFQKYQESLRDQSLSSQKDVCSI